MGRVRHLLEGLESLLEADADVRQLERAWQESRNRNDLQRYLMALVRTGSNIPQPVINDRTLASLLSAFTLQVNQTLKKIINKTAASWPKPEKDWGQPSYLLHPERDLVLHGPALTIPFSITDLESEAEEHREAIRLYRPGIEKTLQELQQDPRVGGAWRLHDGNDYDPLIDVFHRNQEQVRVMIQFIFERDLDAQMIGQVFGS